MNMRIESGMTMGMRTPIAAICFLMMSGFQSLAEDFISTPMRAAPPVIGSDALRGAGYASVWSFDLELPGHETMTGYYLLDENLYAVTSSDLVYAIEARTGLIRWINNLGERSFRERPPTHVKNNSGGGPVVFVTPSFVQVFHRYSGDLIRRFEVPFAPGGAAVADSLFLYMGTAGGKLVSLRWEESLADFPLVRWRATLDGRLLTTPVQATPVQGDDDRFYFVTDTGIVYCVEGRSQRRIWSFDAGGPVGGGVAVGSVALFVASPDRHLYALNTLDGSVVNRHRFPNPLHDRPTVSQDTVYQYCEEYGLYAFDVDTGEFLWRQPAARRFVSGKGDRVVLGGPEGTLLIVDRKTGGVTGAIYPPRDLMTVQNTGSDLIFFATPAGRLGCLGPHGYPPLTNKDILHARSELHVSRRTSLSGVLDLPDQDLKSRNEVDPLRSDRR